LSESFVAFCQKVLLDLCQKVVLHFVGKICCIFLGFFFLIVERKKKFAPLLEKVIASLLGSLLDICQKVSLHHCQEVLLHHFKMKRKSEKIWFKIVNIGKGMISHCEQCEQRAIRINLRKQNLQLFITHK